MGCEIHSNYRITHKIELFERMRSLGLCNAISTCGYIYSLAGYGNV